ncbi:MAG: hypothetical protein JO295_12195 [Verrucomicrobia bacterium]|nr:hypothetical protein [Verrucomicrobiota bacterium]
MKTKTLTILATSSLVVLLSALFFPLFCGMAFIFGVITLSVWEASHLLALTCIAAVGVCTLLPRFRPSAKGWLLPLLFGAAIFIAALCAAIYTSTLTDFSNGFFHPYGLIVFSIGGVLCMAEGFAARTHSRLAGEA